MGKNVGNVRTKFGDYLIDISKYVITAVLITLFFDDISSSKPLMYVTGALVAILTLIWGLFYFKRRK